MVTTVSISTDPTTGQQSMTETQQVSSSGGMKSSENFENTSGAVEVQRNGDTVLTQTMGDMQPDDIVTYQGMQVSVGVLNDMGLLEEVFAGQAQRSAQSAPDSAPEGPQGTPQGDQRSAASNPYDAAEKAIQEAYHSEAMSWDEAQTAATTLGNLEMQQVDVQTAAEAAQAILEGAADYDVADMLGSGDSFSLVKNSIDTMQPLMEASAKAELGDEGFAQLQEMAQNSPAVNAAVLQYGIMRATGQTDGARWSDLLADVANFMRTGE